MSRDVEVDWTAIMRSRLDRARLGKAAAHGPLMPATSGGTADMNMLTQRIVQEAQSRSGQNAPGGGEEFAWLCLDAACAHLELSNPISRSAGLLEQAESLGATSNEARPGYLFANGAIKQIHPDGRRMQTMEVVGGRVVERWNRHVADHATYVDPGKLFP